MQNYTTMQRMKVVEFYYQSQQSIIQAQRKYRKYFNSRIAPSISMIHRLVERFHKQGSVCYLPRAGKLHSSIIPENVERLQGSIEECAGTSTRRLVRLCSAYYIICICSHTRFNLCMN